jgi:lysophospholipase L1-like esterase
MMKQAGAKTLALLSSDGLHMSDLGYRCLARALAEEIEDASRPGTGAKL